MHKQKYGRKAIFTCVMALVLSGCVSTKPADPTDPYASFNRPMYKFNMLVDKGLIKPVAKTYHAILPTIVTERVTYFFTNLDNIPTVFNDLLQGNIYQATSDTWRFAINTTAGIGGLFDVASSIGLQKNNQDFGLTLAKWGYTSSNYLVLPFLGPSTVRDTLGLPVNYMTSIYPYIDTDASYALAGLKTINTRANLLNYDAVLAEAFDQYVFVRNAYLQSRNSRIKNNDKIRTPETSSDESTGNIDDKSINPLS